MLKISSEFATGGIITINYLKDMKKTEPVPTGKDSTLFGVFQNNLPVEIVLQCGGDHPKTNEAVVDPPPLRATRSALSSPSTLPIWRDEYKS